MTRYRLQHWRNRAQSLSSDLPVDVADWLFDPTSLTARLMRYCHGRFSVRVLSQGYRHARLGERRALGMGDRENALIREVHLLCDDKAVVYARTVIPVSTLVGPQRRLAHLGNKPLGAVLFSDNSMQRGEVQVAKLTAGQVRLAEESYAGTHADIWGRRSVFKLNERPLLVSEYFLPNLFSE